MTPLECKATLADNIAASIECALELEALLAAERTALKNQDADELNRSSQSKSACVSVLEELDAGRLALGAKCGFDDAGTAVVDVIAWCGDEELDRHWSAFLDIARVCQQENAANGAAIHVRQQQIKDAIGVLRQGSNDGSTYGPLGQDSGEIGKRSLAEA